MAVGNQQSEDDYNHGLGGSTSSIDGLAIARVSTSTFIQMLINYTEIGFTVLHRFFN